MRILRFRVPVGLARVSDQMIERREVKRPVFGENWQPRLELLASTAVCTLTGPVHATRSLGAGELGLALVGGGV